MRCKICKDKFEPKYFLQKTCFNPTCILEWNKKVKEKEWKKEKKELKESLKTWNDYYQPALRAFNAFIRERDKLNPCISCDAPAGTYKLTSGHYFPQGQNKSTALDEDNAHGQCWFNCNKNRRGNLSEYLPRLIQKIGRDRFEALERKKNTNKRYSIPELIELTVLYKDKLKRLKNESGKRDIR
jgi:hypothetical protein